MKTFSLKQVSEIVGQKIPTMQTWFDKGWAHVTPAEAPGSPRKLTLFDLYQLEVASLLIKRGLNAEVANGLAFICIYIHESQDEHSKRRWNAYDPSKPYPENRLAFFMANPSAQEPIDLSPVVEDLGPGFVSRDLSKPYYLYCEIELTEAIDFSSRSPIVLQRGHTPIVCQKGDHVDLEGCGIYINLTSALVYLDQKIVHCVGE